MHNQCKSQLRFKNRDKNTNAEYYRQTIFRIYTFNTISAIFRAEMNLGCIYANFEAFCKLLTIRTLQDLPHSTHQNAANWVAICGILVTNRWHIAPQFAAYCSAIDGILHPDLLSMGRWLTYYGWRNCQFWPIRQQATLVEWKNRLSRKSHNENANLSTNGFCTLFHRFVPPALPEHVLFMKKCFFREIVCISQSFALTLHVEVEKALNIGRARRTRIIQTL